MKKGGKLVVELFHEEKPRLAEIAARYGLKDEIEAFAMMLVDGRLRPHSPRWEEQLRRWDAKWRPRFTVWEALYEGCEE